MKIQVSNLTADVTEDELRMLFECFGQVASVEMRRTPGNALVNMPDKGAARDAIDGLNNQDLKGGSLSVREMERHPQGNRAPAGKRPRGQRRRR